MTPEVVLLFIAIVLLLLLLFRSLQPGGKENFDRMFQNLERTERVLHDDIGKNREEMRDTLKGFGDSQQQGVERLRESVERRLEIIQRDNSQKLEQMRATVDEKLHATLEKRLGESFSLVSGRLEQVYKRMGEIQTLASDVGDLKKVMTNVKTRGIWGEVQLENILEQVLTPDQYEKNAAVKRGGRERVEFAIRLPKDGVLLPIDAKFPTEDYQRLLDAQEKADRQALDEAAKALELRVKSEARDIRDKYINPPVTTDFAMLFLPCEGLYAEVLRRPGLFETLQRDFKVTVAGPTTILAILNSFRMGFATLGVEKKASEIWQLLGAVKTEFGKFGDILDKTHKKLQEASHTIEDASRKSRHIERKLGKVQELPGPHAVEMLEDEEDNASTE